VRLAGFDRVHAFPSVGAKGVEGDLPILLANLRDTVPTVLDQDFVHDGGFVDRSPALAVVSSSIIVIVDAHGQGPKALRGRVGTDLEGKGAIVAGQALASAGFSRLDGGHTFRFAVIVVGDGGGNVGPAKRRNVAFGGCRETMAGEWR
jgi:hypothetical protein